MTSKPESKPGGERYEPYELALYRLSPLGYWGTTACLFLLAAGSCVLVATLTQRPPLIEINADGTRGVPDVLWIAFVLTLIFTAAPALSQSGYRYWNKFAPKIAETVRPEGRDEALAFGDGKIPAESRRTYQLMTVFGILTGIGLNVVIMLVQGATVSQYLTSIGIWFLITSPMLYATGLRAGYDVAREGRALKHLVREHLEVDLYHLDRLSVYGSVGLRSALSWMVMAAILLLFMVDPSQLLSGLIGMAFATIGAIMVFTSAVRPVHDKTREAKAAELDRIHEAMAEQRERALAGDPEAAGALAGLTDYEQWIEKRPEWPLSPSVTTRLALYVLIPILPIIGSYVFELVADFVIARG